MSVDPRTLRHRTPHEQPTHADRSHPLPHSAHASSRNFDGDLHREIVLVGHPGTRGPGPAATRPSIQAATMQAARLPPVDEKAHRWTAPPSYPTGQPLARPPNPATRAPRRAGHTTQGTPRPTRQRLAPPGKQHCTRGSVHVAEPPPRRTGPTAQGTPIPPTSEHCARQPPVTGRPVSTAPGNRLAPVTPASSSTTQSREHFADRPPRWAGPTAQGTPRPTRQQLAPPGSTAQGSVHVGERPPRRASPTAHGTPSHRPASSALRRATDWHRPPRRAATPSGAASTAPSRATWATSAARCPSGGWPWSGRLRRARPDTPRATAPSSPGDRS